MIKEYFKLQYRFLYRSFNDDGLNPYHVYLFASLLFYGVSAILFHKTEYADPIYCFFAIGLTLPLNEKGRNDFLKITFLNNYKRLRIFENLLITAPFLLFLLIQHSFWYPLFIIAYSIIISIFNFNTSVNRTLPTPFGKQPFEFLVGFRKTFFLLPLAYYLAYQSFILNDYHPGLIAIFMMIAICISFYSIPEKEIFVWWFNLSPRNFLLNKVKTALLYSTCLTLPIILLLVAFFPSEIIMVLAILLLSNLYLITAIFKKYSNFPYPASITEGLLFGISFVFPPLLLLVTPMFYSQAIRSLNLILKNDRN